MDKFHTPMAYEAKKTSAILINKMVLVKLCPYKHSLDNIFIIGAGGVFRGYAGSCSVNM
jgi:hypothetical protein